MNKFNAEEVHAADYVSIEVSLRVSRRTVCKGGEGDSIDRMQMNTSILTHGSLLMLVFQK